MHYEVIVKAYLCALIHEMISVGNAATIWDVAALNIELLGGVIARMQSHSDAYYRRMPCRFRFRAVKQLARNTFSAEYREHIEVLNLRNVQISKSGVSRSPVYGHVPSKLAVKGSDKTGSSSCQLLMQILPVLALRFVPPHVLEGSSDARRIAFFEKPNVNGLRDFHAYNLRRNVPYFQSGV